MKRIRLRVAYDGTDYCGFQLQPEKPTVEGELNRALSELTGEDIYVIGASRTDSGVHAMGNAAVFDTESSIPADRFKQALIKYLPADIRIMESDEVEAGWHPRKNDCIKTYIYTMSFGDTENPLLRRSAMFIKKEPDIKKMEKAAAFLIGEHDFTSFANPSSQALTEGKSAVRTIYSIDIEKKEMPYGGTVTMTIKGNGFLYNMVRIIAGTLINVGRGFTEPEQVKEMLEAKDRTKAGPTAEARGLMLLRIEYT